MYGRNNKTEEAFVDMMRRFDPFFDFESANSVDTKMPADLYREGDTYYLEIDIPGVSLEDIDIEVEKSTLTVSATRPRVRDEERTMIMKGRPHGSFVRRFFLSDGLSPDSIEASYVDGVLKLAIPVAEESKARKIEVVAGQIGRG